MSYVIAQQPDAYSLTSMLKDLILTTTDDTDIDVKINGTSVITEAYTPDADNKIYVRDFGKLIAGYLAGSGFESSTHEGIVCTVNIAGTQGGIISEIGEYYVMLCRAYTEVEATNFFNSNVFLHIMKQKKWITPNSLEYLTAKFSPIFTKLNVFITYFENDNYINSEQRVFIDYPPIHNRYRTVDVSFPLVAALFPEIDPDTIIAYRMVLPAEIAVFMVDRAQYAFTLQFRYKNSFDVPDTIITRGVVTRKGNTTFESSKIGGIYKKFDVKRADTFTVQSGKIFSFNEYDRYREMFNSEDVEVLFHGKWRQIIISDESSEIVQRVSSLDQISFSFYFSDDKDNNIITGESFMRWILEAGQWEDGNMWLDPAHWIDN